MSKPLGHQLPWINHSVTAGMFDTAVTAQLLRIIAEKKTYNRVIAQQVNRSYSPNIHEVSRAELEDTQILHCRVLCAVSIGAP